MSARRPGKYLGEEDVPIEQSPYADWTKEDWILEYIQRYGGFQAAYHKAWVLDQIAQILHGTAVAIIRRKWEHHQEWTFTLAVPTQAYHDWVVQMKGKYIEEDESYEYDYDEGTPP